MAFSRAVFTVLLLSVVCNATVVPVFLWGDLAKLPSKSYPLQTTTTDEFRNILAKELAEQPFVVAFIEKTLSVEDLSRKNGDGESAFPYLHNNLGDGLYVPSVADPLLALDSVANPEDTDRVTLTEEGTVKIEPGTSKFLYINLEDAKEGESRFDLLRRHNDFMASIFTKLQAQYPNLIAIYTAENPSWVIAAEHMRYRRQAEGNSNSSTINVDGLLFYANSIKIQDGPNAVNVQGLSSASTSYNDTEGIQNTTLTYGSNILVLNFKKIAGYWFLRKYLTTYIVNY